MLRYALVLAVDRFPRDPTIHPLNYAERDGRRVEEFLRRDLGFDRVEELLGPHLEKTRALDLARDFAEDLRRQGGGLLVVYYSGHGFSHSGKHCLLCSSARLRDLDEFDHAITVDRLKAVTVLPGVQVQAIVDACRSPLRAGEKGGAGFAAVGLRETIGRTGAASGGGGFAVLASCDDREASLEVEALRHGAFTWSLLRDFEERLRTGEEIRVDQELIARLGPRLEAVAAEHGLESANQHPWVFSNTAPMVLAPGGPSTAEAGPASVPRTEGRPYGGEVLERVRTRARYRANALAQRQEAYRRLYPTYRELIDDPGVERGELEEAWLDLCRACGVADSPDRPGYLEWEESNIRVRPLTGPAFLRWRFENSLGMRFVPVPVSTDGTKMILASIWPTRWQDYAAYSSTNKGVDDAWRRPEWHGVGVTPGPTHPVVCVNWEDAAAFAAWLTRTDQAKHSIPKDACYRLPSDAEWSWMVGIGEAEELVGAERSPSDKHERIKAGTHRFAYPWGADWPPPLGAGNYADLSAKAVFSDWSVVDGYDDGFATTSPVGRFRANELGLYDLGGNVWEWCQNSFDQNSAERVVRGGSWGTNQPTNLLSAYRYSATLRYRFDFYGFRLVLVSGSMW